MAVPDKLCNHCGETKPETSFRKRLNKNKTPYLSGRCRECESKYHRERAAARKSDPEWRHSRWVTNIKSKYGLTKEQYIDMMLEQDFCCAICLEPQRVFYVDHDHACCNVERTCGACVRSLLCNACNTILGLARDNPNTLHAAARYLEVIHGES